jgi:hypothetical protein
MHKLIRSYLNDCVKVNTSKIIPMENGGKFMIKKLSQHQIQLTCSIVDMVDTCDIISIFLIITYKGVIYG